MRDALLVAGHELRRRIRSRSAIVTAFVGPIALAVVFSLLVGDAERGVFQLGVVDADRSQTSQGLVSSLLDATPAADDGAAVRFERVESDAVAREQVDEGDLDGAILVPAGFEAGVQAGAPPQLVALRSPERSIGGSVAQAVATSLADAVTRVSLAVGAVAATTGAPPREGLVAAAQALPPALAVADVAGGEKEYDPAAFYGAAMAILFLFFTVGFAGRSLLVERREGTLARVLASPIRPGAVLAGKAIAVGLLGLTGFLAVWLVTALGFGADWGSPLPVALLIVATTFAVAGVATLVGSFARTDQQADVYTSVTTFVFALLGGNFVGPAAPDLLRTLSLATPNGWALRGFTDLAADASSSGGVALALGVLIAMGVVAGAVGVLRFRRVVGG